MKCPKCGSTNVRVQIVTTQEVRVKHHGLFYWLFFGWWWKMLAWMLFTLPMLIFHFFRDKRYVLVTRTKKVAICNNCGKSWSV